MAFIISGALLIFFIATSLWLTFSGRLEDNLSLGWIFLLAFFGVYFHFCLLCFKDANDVFSALLAVAVSALTLATQGPFVLELVSKSLIPNPSKGLKLIKVHSEAERMVAGDDLPGAIAEYERLTAEDPDDIAARFRLADLCYQNKDYPKTIEVYKALVAHKGKLDMHQHCSALMRLSEISAQQMSDIEGARRYLEEIIKEHPNTKLAGYAMNRLNNLK